MRHLYRMSQGSWQPARLIQTDILLACYAAVVQGAFRSWDYSTGQEAGKGPKPGLSLVERAFPLWVWSLSFAIGSLILLVGVKQRRHLVVWVGHFWLFGAYLTLGVGIAIPAFEHPYLDGIRSATVLILPTVLHFILLRRTGPKPSRSLRALEKVGGPT